MQIILVQSEVESAIRNYVASRLTLAEGTNIQIDLSATRGQDGIKATIDLVEPGAAPKVSQASEKPAAALSTPKAIQPTAPAQEPAAAPSVAPEAASPVADTQQAAAEVSAEGAHTESGNQEAAPARSLFGNLARPKNS